MRAACSRNGVGSVRRCEAVKIRAWRCTFSVAVALVASTICMEGAGAKHNVITGSAARAIKDVSLRSGPSASYAVKARIPCGASVSIVSGPDESSWYKVKYGSTRGYIAGGYLTRRLARTVMQLSTSAKLVFLTFDAGSDTGYSRQILDTLRAKNAKASFGITGEWANDNPALVRRIVSDGHSLINHTYSHRSLTGFSTGTKALGYAVRRSELASAESAVTRVSGESTKPYFRPPYGDYDSCALAHISHEGYRYNVLWSHDSLGWRGLTRKQIVQRVLAALEPGAIYLFHVGGKSHDGRALPQIVDELRARGYTFARIADHYR